MGVLSHIRRFVEDRRVAYRERERLRERVTYFGGDDVEGFESWREDHPSGYVFTLRSGTLHRARCRTLRPRSLASRRGRGVPRVVTLQREDIDLYTRTHGFKVNRCTYC